MHRYPSWLVDAVTLLIVVLGTANFVASFVVKGWSPDPILSTMFLGVVGAVLGIQFVRKGEP